MSKPHDKQNPPAEPGQIKTMFVTEGIPNAVLVTEGPGGITADDTWWFPDVSHAFELCRRNRWHFAYSVAIDARS
jgi:hypothetical protein